MKPIPSNPSNNIEPPASPENLTNNINNENNNQMNDEDMVDEIEQEDQQDEINQEKENLDSATKTEAKTQPEDTFLGKLFIFLRSGFAWRPIPTIRSTVLCLEISGIIFLLLGILILVLSSKINEIEIRYDNDPACENQIICDINFTIEKDMKKTVMVYYRLKNFYQNHRRYIKSKSYKQLKGNVLKESEVKDDCDPVILNKDIYEGVKNFGGTIELDQNAVAHPCGLIARSYFNDSFSIKKKDAQDENGITISDEDIAWSVDKKKYKNAPNSDQIQWLNVEEERFIVWMRPAALPDFRKLWGKIDKDLSKGDYVLSIKNNYPVKSFEGEKYFILSTVNVLGGKNYFLGIIYLVVAGICIVSGFLFIIGYKVYNDEKTIKIE